MKLPVKYSETHWSERKNVRNEYAKLQENKCYWCKSDLNSEPPSSITGKKINWELFPENFMKYPVHLQHDHDTDLTEGAVHNYCNAVMWQYHGK